MIWAEQREAHDAPPQTRDETTPDAYSSLRPYDRIRSIFTLFERPLLPPITLSLRFSVLHHAVVVVSLQVKLQAASPSLCSIRISVPASKPVMSHHDDRIYPSPS